MSILNPKSVYLAGSMSGLKGFGRAWRRSIQRWLEERGLPVYNPCIAELKYKKKYGVHANLYKWESLPEQMRRDIVLRDLDQVANHSLFVICYYTQPLSGTSAEILEAARNKVPLFIMTKRRLRMWQLDAALRPTSRIFRSWVDLKNHLSYSLKLRKRRTIRKSK